MVFLGVFDDYMSLQQNQLTSLTKLGGTPTYFPHLFSQIESELTQPTGTSGTPSPFISTSSSMATMLEELREGPRCGVCGRRMFLLAQAYAPAPSFTRSSPSAAHNRMLYVWCCNSAGCSFSATSSPSRVTPENWKCVAVQLDREDEEAFGEAAECQEEDEDDELYRETPLPLSALHRPSFPPCHVHIIPEPPKFIGALFPLPPPKKEVEEALRKKVEDPNLEQELKALDKEVDLKNSAVDYHYDAFRVRLEREPQQVIRYYPSPLLPSSSPSTTSTGLSDPSTCEAEVDTTLSQPVPSGEGPIFMNPACVLPYFTPTSTTSQKDKTQEKNGDKQHGSADAIHTTTAISTTTPTCHRGDGDRTVGKHEEEPQEDPIQKELQLAEECAAAVTAAELSQRCVYCGGPLRAEMQIMPTSLYFLHGSNYLPPTATTTKTTVAAASASTPLSVQQEDQSIDFGTVTIWTCARWCRVKERGVVVDTNVTVLVEPPPLAVTKNGKKGSDEVIQALQKTKTDLRAFMTSKEDEEEK